MIITIFDIQILLIAVLSAVACAIPGNFLVLRKMSLLGDAISHAVLPGIAIAFIITQSRESPLMFILAVVSGVFVAAISKIIQQKSKSEESATLGTVFAVLFSIGLILIAEGAEQVDLDPSCVLYGALELAPLESITLFNIDMPRSLPRLIIVILLNASVVYFAFKELNISSFDADFARNVGIRTDILHYIFIALIAITTVAVFEMVGSILVIAMLVAPAATARLLCNRLKVMIFLSIVIAIITAIGGYFIAILLPQQFGFSDTTAAGVMAALSGALFFGAVLYKQWSLFVHMHLMRRKRLA